MMGEFDARNPSLTLRAPGNLVALPDTVPSFPSGVFFFMPGTVRALGLKLFVTAVINSWVVRVVQFVLGSHWSPS